MTLARLNPPTVATPVGAYSHAVMAPADGVWLHISGQVGILPDGTVAAGFSEQARAAWSNLMAILVAANMDVGCLVKVTTFLTDAGDLPDLVKVRSAFLADTRPASTLLVVKALARPEWSIEIEAVAFSPNGRVDLRQ